MPTGYTVFIEEGCGFEEFVWRCARAIGACGMMRDDPIDAPVLDEFSPNDHYAKAVVRAEAEIARLVRMTAKDLEDAGAAERAETVAENTRYAEEHREKAALYDAMLARVEAWVPPSADHVGLKDFMLEQIRISVPGEPYQRKLPPSDPAEWLDDKLADARWDLDYYRKRHAEELERTANLNRWVRRLRESVPQPVMTPKD